MAERAIRFGVGDGVHRASTWKCWTNVGTGKSDVYLGARELAYAMKASMHESGRWHIAFDKKFLEEAAVATEWPSRFQDVWTAPSGSRPGFTVAFRIVTMRGGVNVPISTNDRGITWISPPPDDRALEIDVIVVTAWTGDGWPGRDRMGTSFVGRMEKEDGSIVFVVSHLVPKPAGFALTANPGRFFHGKTPDALRSDDLRAIFFRTEPDGSRVMYDVAILPPEKPETE